MTLPLLKPALYRAQGTPALPEHPALLGGTCRCGHVFYPWQSYGCERCGAAGDALTPMALSGRGKVEASAVVHLHASPERQAPFTVTAVRLDDGPLVRTLALASETGQGTGLVPGDAVVAVLAEVSDRQQEGSTPARALDLRFVRVA
ncbi:hypothetical protein BJN34_25520 [Cupriavidus necator]|uniref:DUF35 domain-containing protein n=1 Tax=Cupriavidus necator TaxID=106590 RepID=A0A1U9UWY4_CUPNE|nr:hypothetical protein [Cupriavidus necator]AQV97224.1 hypothetical protein BJN34_25520 [Cupriavidus necator]